MQKSYPPHHLFWLSAKGCVSDGIAWSYNSKGIFSVGSYRRVLEELQEVTVSIPTFFWKGFGPLNVEFFSWQLWRGCCTNTVKEWLTGWTGLCPVTKLERVWCSMFSAIVWTIWESRNQLNFEGKNPSVQHASDLVKFMIVWWFKHLRKGCHDSVQSLLLNFQVLCVKSKKNTLSRIKDWTPPSVNTLKFNVDGSSRGKPEPAGIREVLRDSNGKFLCLFSFSVGIADSNSTEIWAIQKAVELCLAN
ncbi:hypothetical protein Dsin_003167 [Dipteronia sinensis]|uniref:RNase H type-1 domain-containing protein n=1 Tax=Dipteronia sinensis TaxID=43782 RepID=A0AAE0B7L1_9ROSI|nr:hypothetical protein Dsin_003167 [Dipteronia sinensis]